MNTSGGLDDVVTSLDLQLPSMDSKESVLRNFAVKSDATKVIAVSRELVEVAEMTFLHRIQLVHLRTDTVLLPTAP